jgi:hypothetical protein
LVVRPEPNAPDGFVVHSFANDDPIACKDYVREKCGLPAFKAKAKDRKRASHDEIAALLASAVQSQRGERKIGRLVATYQYTDEKGTLLYEVLRFEPKAFRQRRPDGKGDWIWNVNDVRRVLYRLPDLMAFPDATVFVTEGEKDADRVASLGHCATAVAGGLGSGLDTQE